MFQHRRGSQSPVVHRARNKAVSVLLNGGRRTRGGRSHGQKVTPSLGRQKPGILGAAAGSTAAHPGASDQTGPSPEASTPSEKWPGCPFPHGPRGKLSSFPLANLTLKVILYPLEQAMEKERFAARLPFRGGRGWSGRGAPVFIFLPDSLGL